MSIEIGDTVWTNKILFFVDGHNPETGDTIELMFDSMATMTVVGKMEDGSYECKTKAGMIAYIHEDHLNH